MRLRADGSAAGVEEVRGRRGAHERAETLQRPLAGVDYDDLLYAPGDGVVTSSSLLGRTSEPPQQGAAAIRPLPLSHSVFLCEQHQFLTGNPTFQNNLLHTLFASDPEPRVSESLPDRRLNAGYTMVPSTLRSDAPRNPQAGLCTGCEPFVELRMGVVDTGALEDENVWALNVG